MDLNKIATAHYAWVARMGWHNTTVLENLALIASEIGETVTECLTAVRTPAFGEELADILLRALNLAKWQGVDLLPHAMARTPAESWHGNTPLAWLGELMPDLGACVNAARVNPPAPAFGQALRRLILRVQAIATSCGVDLEAHVLRKMAINEQNGNRGRKV